jgi:hypothetical protein
VALAAGCGETLISISSDGRIEVSVSTSGTDPDSDGFSVTVDGGAEHVVGPAGDVVLDGLSAGSHSVLLGGLAQNCAVVGSNPRPVIVGSDGRAEVSFEVRVRRPVGSPSRLSPPGARSTPTATGWRWQGRPSARSGTVPSRSSAASPPAPT